MIHRCHALHALKSGAAPAGRAILSRCNPARTGTLGGSDVSVRFCDIIRSQPDGSQLRRRCPSRFSSRASSARQGPNIFGVLAGSHKKRAPAKMATPRLQTTMEFHLLCILDTL